MVRRLLLPQQKNTAATGKMAVKTVFEEKGGNSLKLVSTNHHTEKPKNVDYFQVPPPCESSVEWDWVCVVD